MIEVEVHLRAHLNAEPATSVVRPLRVLPDGVTPGVVYRRAAYPLHRERGGAGRLYVLLTDIGHDKDDCPVLREAVSLSWADQGDDLRIGGDGPAVGNLMSTAALDWRVASNAFGSYLLFNGDKIRVNQVLRALEIADYAPLRLGSGATIGPEGAAYDWCVRLDTADEPERIRDAFGSAWAGRQEQRDDLDQPNSHALAELRAQLAEAQARLSRLSAQRDKTDVIQRLVSQRLIAVQGEQHVRAKKLREVQAELRQEQVKSHALLEEIDRKSLAVLRLQQAGKDAELLRGEIQTLRISLLDAQTELAILRSRGIDGDAASLEAANARAEGLRAELDRLGHEQEALLRLASAAEHERDEAQTLAQSAKRALDLLRTDVESSLLANQVALEELENKSVSLDVIDLEIRDLFVRIDNLAAMRTATRLPELSEDDEASDLRVEHQTRSDRLQAMLRGLAAVAFPRLRLSENSLDEIVSRGLESDELWRELANLDRKGDLERAHSRLGRSEWRELRFHVNERTRIYWRPHDGQCLVHVWWKTSGAAQQRLHDGLERDPNFGFGGSFGTTP
jgi:hypothetical protein